MKTEVDSNLQKTKFLMTNSFMSSYKVDDQDAMLKQIVLTIQNQILSVFHNDLHWLIIEKSKDFIENPRLAR